MIGRGNDHDIDTDEGGKRASVRDLAITRGLIAALIMAIAVLAASGCAKTVKIRFKTSAPPKVFVGEVKVYEVRDKETLGRDIKGRMEQIKDCHRQALQRRPGLKGKVRAKWHILPTGFTTDVTTIESTVNDPTMESCIVSVIQTWRFPPVENGAPLQVTYPFIFGDDEPIPQPTTIVVPPQVPDTDGENTGLNP